MESPAVFNDVQRPRRDSTRWWYFAAGCGTGFLIAICLAAVATVAGLGGLVGWGAAPTGLSASYDIPARVSVDQEFDLELRITNNRDTELTVGDIDLRSLWSTSLLDGITVLRTEPPMQADATSASGVVSYLYHRVLDPGETVLVVFHMRAGAPGRFGGPILIYEGLKSLSVGDVYVTVTP